MTHHTPGPTSGLLRRLPLVLLALLGACSGDRSSGALEPTVTELAVFVDENQNGLCDEGDTVLLTFTASVVSQATADDFALPVLGDAFGTGATVEPAQRTDQVRIRLGANPSLKTRGPFADGALSVNASSGIDLSDMAAPNAIVAKLSGLDAIPGGAIDLVPGFADPLDLTGATPNVLTSLVVDVDADGDRDLVLGTAGPNRVFLSNGEDEFVSVGQDLGSTTTRALAAGDLDGDGRMDLVEGNDASQPDQVWFGDGGGHFFQDILTIGGQSTRALALGDLDRDGDLDLATVGLDPNRIHLNDGTAAFLTTTQALGGLATEGAALGDLDADGDLDLVTGNAGGQTNRLYLNTSTAAFVDSGSPLGRGDTRALVLGDVDQDGDLDVVAGNFGEENLLLLNDGFGGIDREVVIEGSMPTVALCLADADSDGDLDLFEGNDGEPSIQYINEDGAFLGSGQDVGEGASAGIGLADVDGDGDMDLIGVDRANGASAFGFSLTGTWGIASYSEMTAIGDDPTNAVAVGDLDRDGRLDLVEARGANQPNSVFFGDGRGDFEDSGLRLGFYETTALALADVDTDGDLDLVTANDLRIANRIYMNPGNGELFDSEQTLGESSSTSVAAGDLNGTGLPDLFVGNRDGFPNRVYTNSDLSRGSFTDSFDALGQRSTFGVALGDLDQDGDLDAVTGNDSEDRIWLNSGLASFEDFDGLPGSDAPTRALALSDVDNDGDLDVLAGRDVLFVYRNGGEDELFSMSPHEAVYTGDARAVSVADVDGDGDGDLIVADFTNPSTVLLNDGDGAFPDSFSLTAPAPTTSLATADLDRDGDADIVLGNESEPNPVFEND